MSGIDKRLAEAIRDGIVRSHSVARRAGDLQTDGWLRLQHEASMAAAAVAPLVEEARAEGYAEGTLVLVASEPVARARATGHAEGYAAALTDAQAAIKALDELLPATDRASSVGAHRRQALDAVARLGKADAPA